MLEPYNYGPSFGWVIFYAVVFILIVFAVMCAFAYANSEVDTTKAVIHHTASGDVSAATIDGWHKARKDSNGKSWSGIGYHYVIRKDGTIEKGRSIIKQGAHALGRNHYVGIVLTGYDEFTEEQLNSLVELIKRLDIEHIERHHEECPGLGIDLEDIRKRAGI